VCPLVLAG